MIDVPVMVGEIGAALWPGRFGVPLPRAAVFAPESLRLIDTRSEQSIPMQCRVLNRWVDGSIRWVLLVVDTKALEPAAELRLRSDAETFAAQDVVQVEQDSHTIAGSKQTWRLTTGADRLWRADVTGLSWPFAAKLVLTDSRGEKVAAHIDSVTVEENGPVAATVCITGHFPVSGSAGDLLLVLRLSIPSSGAAIIADVDLWNPRAARHVGGLWDLGDTGSVRFRDLSFELHCEAEASQLSCDVHTGRETIAVQAYPWVIYQDSSGGENWSSSNHVDALGDSTVNFRGFFVRSGNPQATVASGDRCQPTLAFSLGGHRFAIELERFWQQFPSAIRAVSSTQISIGLFPEECPAGFELQGGERKRQRIYLAEVSADAGMARSLCHLPEFSVDPEWIASTKAIPYFAAPDADDDRTYLSYIDSIIDGDQSFERLREVIDEYGWRNFGELYADHESVGSSGGQVRVSHYNNQYDFLYAAIVHFLRSGDRRWRELFEPAARHHRDIDIYHTDRDRAVYNGGLFWHTDHYRDAATATHRTYSDRNGALGSYGGGPSNEHNYTTGLLHYYWLTGDQAAREAVISLADWVVNMDDPATTVFRVLNDRPTGKASATASPDYHGPGRGAGNSINALVDGFSVTSQRDYLGKAESLIQRCSHPNDDVATRELDNPELRWSYLVFLQAIAKYLVCKRELGEFDYHLFYARDVLLTYARWMVENELPYKEQLHKVDCPTETWPAQDVRKAHVFHVAALCCHPDESGHFKEQALRYFSRGLDDLLEFETAYLTRPRVILAAYGYVHLYFAGADHADDYERIRVDHGFDFGLPSQFVSQTGSAQQDARTALGIMRGEFVRLLRDRLARVPVARLLVSGRSVR